MNKMDSLAVIGLGYVGLPLAVEFAKVRKVVGFDVNKNRVANLLGQIDETGEVSPLELSEARHLKLTSSISDLKDIKVFIVTVPTPICADRSPDLAPLIAVSEMLGDILRPGSVVIFESTVYPGCTEEICVPILEQRSKLVFNRDFYCGYSPERINPGDKTRGVRDIVKVTSGSTSETTDFVDGLYAEIISAGTHRAPSIKVAEAAKVIENTQRDLNIALINELSRIFDLLEIDTEQVLQAAETKWNFLSFRPGLVGGHCIGVDPYYLTHKAIAVGYSPEIILAGRELNDGMAHYVVERTMNALSARPSTAVGMSLLVLGLTFKENCPDTRNSKSFDLITHAVQMGFEVDAYDPFVTDLSPSGYRQFSEKSDLACGVYDAVIVAVAHDEFVEWGASFVRSLTAEDGIIFDLKHIYPKASVDLRL